MTYLFLTPVLAAGTVTDLRFRKVPNGVIGFGAAAGLAILTAERLSGDGGNPSGGLHDRCAEDGFQVGHHRYAPGRNGDFGLLFGARE